MEQMDKNTVNIYWSPQTTSEVSELGEWNMLYPEPVTLFRELQKIREIDTGQDTYFACPATNDKFRKTYVFKNELPSSYEFDFTSDDVSKKYFKHTSNTYINYDIKRPPSIAKGPLVNLNLYYSFFSEEPIEAVFTPPMFHEPKYTKYGTCVPGQFDVGQWFRPYPLEMQMWNMKGEFHLEFNEPIFYVEFKTTKKVNLQRFKMNKTLVSYLEACSTTKRIWGPGLSLQDRYARFKRTRMRELILKEIKENLLDDYK